jgi:hypothetical protein
VSVSVFVDVDASVVITVTEAETAEVDVTGVSAVSVDITVVFAEIFIYIYDTELGVEPTSYRKMFFFLLNKQLFNSLKIRRYMLCWAKCWAGNPPPT